MTREKRLGLLVDGLFGGMDAMAAYQNSLRQIERCHCGSPEFGTCKKCNYEIGDEEIVAFGDINDKCDARFAFHWLRHVGWEVGVKQAVRKKTFLREKASIPAPVLGRRYDLSAVAHAEGVSVKEIRRQIVDWIEKTWIPTKADLEAWFDD